MGGGQRIFCRMSGIGQVLVWEDGPRILRVSEVWRDADIAKGGDRLVLLEDTDRAERVLPLLVALSYFPWSDPEASSW